MGRKTLSGPTDQRGGEIESPLPRELYFVLDRPYSLWSSRCALDNDHFIKSLNAKFYSRLSSQLGRRKLSNDVIRSEVGGVARIFWHQAIETFITLVGATLQAPRACHGFFTHCKNEDVRQVGSALQRGERLPFEAVVLAETGWGGLFKAVFSITKWHDDGVTAEFFTRAVREMVSSYLSDLHRLEYNSIKHGMRVNFGSSQLEITSHDKEDSERNKIVLGSKDSSHLLALRPAGNLSRKKAKIHHQVERITLGWSLERTIQDLGLLSMAIENVRNLLLHALGSSPNKLRFVRPSMDDEDRQEYFSQRPQLANFVMREGFKLNDAMAESEEQIRNAFQVVAKASR